MDRDERARVTTLLPQIKKICGSRSTYHHTRSMLTADSSGKGLLVVQPCISEMIFTHVLIPDLHQPPAL